MTQTHVGRIGRGGRLHLTDSEGWSACGRQAVTAAPLDELRRAPEERWCLACMARVATRGLARLEAFKERDALQARRRP